jgi:hypothetical protein
LPPARFTLFFVEGKDEFTDESKLIVDASSPRSPSGRFPT